MKKFISTIVIFTILMLSVACSESTDNSTDTNNSSIESTTNESKSESSNPSSITDASSSSSTESSEVSNIVNGPSQKSISDIPVTVNGKNQLSSNGYRISGSFDMKVSIVVTGDPSTLDVLTAEDIKANVDVSTINEEGEIQCVIDIVVPDGISLVSSSDSIATLKIKKVSAEITPPEVDDIRIVNGVLISGNRAMEQFGGSAAGGGRTAETINGFKQAMGDVNVYVLPAPLASAFYAPVGYEKSITRHKDCFYGLRDGLKNVGFVDTISAISPHVDETIYFRTDHHWQALAAYYACEELASVAGVPFDNISTFTVKSEDGILGSFYSSYTHDPVLGNNPDTMVWYEPTREHTVDYYSRSGVNGTPTTGRTLFSTNSGYTKFIYGDSYTTHIKSNVGNGRKLLLFKDSYGNALAPFLVGSFEEVYIADYRYFETDVSDFIAEKGITDVCFSIAAFGVNNFKGLNINY